MGNSSTVRKRWRPTFSLRSLILLTTIVCLLLAGWHSTVTRGVKLLGCYLGVDPRGANIVVKAPFVMARPLSAATYTWTGLQVVATNTFYLWTFGQFIKLPFTTEDVRNTGPPPPGPRLMPPMRGSSPSGPAETPPYERTMPYRLETAFAGEVAGHT